MQHLNLLTTKLHIPNARPYLVARPRLTNHLNQALQSKLTLISAPAGFGKTTLLTEWLFEKSEVRRMKDEEVSSRSAVYRLPPTNSGLGVMAESNSRSTVYRLPPTNSGLGVMAESPSPPTTYHLPPTCIAWVSLDENDQDAALFWGYVITALDKFAPELAKKLLPVLCAPQAPPLETILTDLINRLSSFEDDFVLVLDDYHSINNPAIHTSLMFLIDKMPPQMHLIMTSRADPPLHLPRLRVRGQLIEIRAENLRFSLDETRAFLSEIMGIELSPTQLQALEERTEGWVAGLQLAALSMQRRSDLAGFISDFTGSHRYILDYVLEEVLEQQPALIQTFLLQTAILERLNGSLCEAVTRQPNGKQMLERLERANMFLIPLDDTGEWYRYHHLFAELLRYRLQQTTPELLPELYLRAGEWCQQHNLSEEAVHYFLSGHNFRQAAVLLEQFSRQMVGQGRMPGLLEWLDKLPDAVMDAHPRLCIAYAWARSFTGQVEKAQGYVERAERALLLDPESQEKQKELWGEVRGWRTTIITSYQRDFRRGIILAQQALEDLPSDNLYLRSWVMRNMGEAYLLNGELAKAEEAYRDGIKLGQASHNNFITCASAYGFGLVMSSEGRLYEAEQHYRRMLQWFAEAGGPELPVTCYLYIGLADVLREWNDLEAALNQIEKGLVLARQGNFTSLLIWGYPILAQIKQALGDSKAALEAQKLGQQELPKYKPIHYGLQEGASFARLLLQQGQLEAADRWAREFLSTGREAAKAYSYYLLDYMNLTLVRVWLAQGRTAEALNLLDNLQKHNQGTLFVRNNIEIDLLKALALASSNKFEQALPVLLKALISAEPAGYIRLFADTKAKVIPLLSAIRRTPNLPNNLRHYLSRLLKVLEVENDSVRVDSVLAKASPPEITLFRKNGLIKPLTEREIEVLSLLTLGQSPPDIAQSLVISQDTVKKHIKNIYGKLNAHSRFEAIVRARELRLIEV